ncbi:MAG: hypothetical protein K2V38_25595, partial [Gemmataceae bacterium]|nr:hypothetical protein [Gemmataceae bacterium]
MIDHDIGVSAAWASADVVKKLDADDFTAGEASAARRRDVIVGGHRKPALPTKQDTNSFSHEESRPTGQRAACGVCATEGGQMEPIDTAYAALQKLLAEPPAYWDTLHTEADVRMKVVDRMFVEVL